MTNSISALDKFDFVFFDTETTGLSPSQGHRVITASVFRADSSFQGVFSHTTRVNPDRPSDPGALAVHGISNEEAASFPAFTRGDADILAQRDREPAIWAAHKASFDLDFLSNEFSIVGAEPPKAVAFVDTVQMAKKLWPGQSAKLQDLYERHVASGSHGVRFHSSDDDTGALRDVFQVMRGEMQQRGTWSMEGLAATQRYGTFLSWPEQTQKQIFTNVNMGFEQSSWAGAGYNPPPLSAKNYVFGASSSPPPAAHYFDFAPEDGEGDPSIGMPVAAPSSLWTQGRVPHPFDLLPRDRLAFSSANRNYIQSNSGFFHRQGIDVVLPSGGGTGYSPALASWGDTRTPRGNIRSNATFRVGTWGYHTKDSRPTLGGKIITPVLQIDDSSGTWQARMLQPRDIIGRALTEGRSAAQKHINEYYDKDMDEKSFESLVRQGERMGASVVRSGVGMFAASTRAERYTATPGYTAAMQSSIQLENIGKYGILPRDLFNIIGKEGYFTRKSSPSQDASHPERSTWSMYHVSSLASSGWLYNPNVGEHGTFRTDISLDKLPKRRQLQVQTAAVMDVDERLFSRVRRSRLSRDRSGAKAMHANALLVDNYPASEGTAVIHPDAAPTGFRKMQYMFIEQPWDVKNPDAWSIDWNLQKQTEAGKALFLGKQMVNGREVPLQTVKGIRGVRQELWGVRQIDEEGRRGFELAIGEHHPTESGGFKIFHSGIKALMMKSRSMVEGFRRSTGKEFDVISPLPKSWQLLQYGMIDYLPKNELLGLLGEGGMERGEANRLIMGIRENPKAQYQHLGPLQDALTKAIRGRHFEFEHAIEMDKRNVEAFRMSGSLVAEKRLDADRVLATIKMSGYNLPIPLQYRQEYPGKKPFYSPEEVKRLGTKLESFTGNMADQAKIELTRLRRGNAAARIFGAAVAMEKGYAPKSAMSHEDIDWIDIGTRIMDIPGDGDEPMLQAIDDQMREREKLYITGPNGVVFPRPSDVRSMGSLNLQGREISTFATSYARAVSGLSEISDEVLGNVTEFGKQLSKMGSYSSVRRHAMGKMIDRGIEGPYVGHVGIPDEYMVAGDDALMRLGGLRNKKDLARFKIEIEKQGFYAALSRRPQSSPTMQFETMLRVVSPEYAKEAWGVEIEDLGRNFALSTTTAGVQRGDFDADRAIARALTRKVKGGELFTPDYYDFKKNDQRKQILTALRQQSPEDYSAYRATLTPEQSAQLDSALAGNLKDDMAIVRATYGVGLLRPSGAKSNDAKWNELAKWTESLEAQRLQPDNPDNSSQFWKSVKGPLLTEEMYTYTGAQVIDAFRRKHVEPKSQMGPIFNQNIRGLSALAVGPEESVATESLGAITYQDTIDMEPMRRAVATILDMTYYLGKSGVMHRRYSEPAVGESNFKKVSTNPGAILGVLLDEFKRLPVSRDMQAVLFSRDPQIQAWYKQGDFLQITKEINRRGAGDYMADPNQAGPLVQLVRSQQLSKSSWTGKQKTTMEEAAMRTGEGLRSYRDVYSKRAMSAGDITDKLRTMVDKPAESRFMRSMLAERTGMYRDFFRSDEDIFNDIASFENKALPGNEFPASISLKEADVLEGLRQMPAHQAQHIAAMISRPARYTPAGAMQSFSTDTDNSWDKMDLSKLSAEQRKEIIGMKRVDASNEAAQARYREMLSENALFQASDPKETFILEGSNGRTLDSEVIGLINPSGDPGQESVQMRPGMKRDDLGIEYYPDWEQNNPAAWSNYQKSRAATSVDDRAEQARGAHSFAEQVSEKWGSVGNVTIPSNRMAEVHGVLGWVEGHSVRATTYDLGRSYMYSLIKDKSAWAVSGRNILLAGFEAAAKRDLSSADEDSVIGDMEIHAASGGRLYNEWRGLIDRPTDAQIAGMSPKQQVAAYEAVIKNVMDTVAKMELGTGWGVELPESYALLESQIPKLQAAREALWKEESYSGGGGGGRRASAQIPADFERILRQGIAGSEIAAGDLNLVARTMGASWEGRLREMAVPSGAQGKAMTPAQVKSIARQRLGVLAQAKRLYGDQEPEWLKAAYQEGYDAYKQARQNKWNEPLTKDAEQASRLQKLAQITEGAYVSSDLPEGSSRWVLENFGSGVLGNIEKLALNAADPTVPKDQWLAYDKEMSTAARSLAGVLKEYTPQGLAAFRERSVQSVRGQRMEKYERAFAKEQRRERASRATSLAIEYMAGGGDASTWMSLVMDNYGYKDYRNLSVLDQLPSPETMATLTPGERVKHLSRAHRAATELQESQGEAGLSLSGISPLRSKIGNDLSLAKEEEAAVIKQATARRREEMDLIQRHTATLKSIVEGPAGKTAASVFSGALTNAQGAIAAGRPVDERTSDLVSAGAAFYKKAGYEKEASEFAASRDEIELQAMAGGIAGQPSTGSLRERIANAFASASGNRQRSNSMMGGYLGQLNFGMWGAQMWWKWTGQPVQNWAQQYGGQQLQAQQAMFAAGQVNGGITGVPMDIMQTQAGVANAQWYLGQAGYNRWVRPLNALTGFISDNAQTVAQPIVDAMAGAGVLGLGQLGMTMLGSATGISGIGALGPYRLAGSFLKNTASMAGLGGSAFNATTGAITAGGIASGLTGIGMYSGWLINQAQEDIRYGPGNTFGALSTAATLTGQFGLAGQFRIASGFAGEDSWFRQKLENLPVIGDAYRFGGNILDRFMNAAFGLEAPDWFKDTSQAPAPTDAITKQALGLKQYGIGVDQGTQLITSLNQMLGRGATDAEVVAFSKQGVQYPGGMQQQLASYNQIFQATGAIAGTSDIAKIIAGSTGLTPAQIDQYTVASKIVGSVGDRYGWTPGDIWDKAQPIQTQIARGVTPAEIQARYAASLGRAGIASQYYGVEPGTELAKRIEATQSNLSLERQEQVGSWRSRMVETLRSGGMSAERVEPYVADLSSLYSSNMQELTEMTVLAKSVILQTDRGTIESLMQEARGAGVIGMSPAQRQQWFQRSGGFAGLAPTTMVQGGTQAASFETGLALQPGMTVYQNAAAQILQQTRPSGYSQGQLDLVAGRLYRGESINTVSSDLLATSGRMGIGAGMGFGVGTGASAAIDVQARSTAQFLSGQGTVSERASYLASFVSNPQYLTGSRAAAALAPGSPAAIAYQKVDSGQWSPYQGGLMAQLADKFNPLGYTANLAFEQGKIDEFLAGGVPAGGLQDIYGRQPGAAALFGAQQASGWSSYRLGMAQEDVRHARFGRQVNEWRQEWGSGAYVSPSQIASARRAEYGAWQDSVAQMSPGDAKVALEQGFQFSGKVGGSQVGLVQQEAAIRRQMWQENLNSQRQSFAFAQQQLQIQKEQFAISKQQYDVQREYQLSERDAGRGMQVLQRQWSEQDWAIQGERTGITNQWAQEDIGRAIRYSTGRERIQLMRQRDRMTLQQGWEQEDRGRNQDRQRQQWRYEDERYTKSVEYEQKLHEIQMQRFALQERSLELQGAQLAAQMAQAEKMIGFELELQKIEDQRFKTNFENMQAQIEEELKLEPIRQEAVKADLAYQAARLSNAQLMWDNELKYMEMLKKEIIDVMAEWVKLQSAKSGQTSPSTVSNQCPTCGKSFATPAELQAHLSSSGHGNMRSSVPMRGGTPVLPEYNSSSSTSQPVTVNFILDGEVIMSTVVTPERLRPVVQEVNQRNSRR